jgi:hypothetical protein
MCKFHPAGGDFPHLFFLMNNHLQFHDVISQASVVGCTYGREGEE